MGQPGIRRPVVYFEEWDSPHISAIRWVSEMNAVAGGVDCFAALGKMLLGRDRIIANGEEIVARNPDIIIGSDAARSFVPKPWWPDRVGVTYQQYTTGSSLKSNGSTSYSQGLLHSPMGYCACMTLLAGGAVGPRLNKNTQPSRNTARRIF